MTTTPPERWWTFAEAAVELEERYGYRTTKRYLQRLANGGKPLPNGRPPLPSSVNFGRRQVQLSQILPYLERYKHVGGA